MKQLLYLIIGICLCAGITSCHIHSEESHSQYDGHNHSEDKVHNHEEEYPTSSYTVWTKQTELFVEYPVLAVGNTSKFATHFSSMQSFKPIKSAVCRITLGQNGNVDIEAELKSPNAPGLFVPELTPTKAGIFDITFYISNESISDTIRISDVKVYASEDDAIHNYPKESETDNVAFSKEQAWKIDFAVSPVQTKSLHSIIRTSGEVLPIESDESSISASTSGVVIFKSGNLIEGQSISKGTTLFAVNNNKLISDNLSEKYAVLKAKLDQSKKTFVDPKTGMKSGPYMPSPHANVRFFFIYHQPDRIKYVAPLWKYFTDGYKTFYPSLKNYIKQPFDIDEGTSLAYESPETALHELKTHLINLNKVPDTRYVAIYVSPIHKEAEEHNELYYQVKEELLKHSITSQVIYKESILNNYFGAFLENIAPAILAKIDGIPWRLDRELLPQLIVGIGAFKSNQLNRRYVGSAFCFNNKGEFKGFDCLLDNELDLLAQKIEKKILNFFVDHGQHADKLVIHYYKPFSTRELDPIRKTLEKLGLTIPIVVVTINKTESSDFIAFDKDSKDLMPVSGTYFEIMKGKFILFNNARHNPDLASPRIKHFPVKLSLFCTDDDYFNDNDNIKEVIDQVYQFSRMYWKSVRQQNLPVTIKYPEMVAKIFPFFEGDKIPDFGKNNLWFL